MPKLPEGLWMRGLLCVCILCSVFTASAHSEADVQAQYQKALSQIKRLEAALESAQNEIRRLRGQLQSAPLSGPTEAESNVPASEEATYQNALAALSREIDANPDNAGAYAKRGAIQLQLQASPQAIQDFDAALAKGFADKAVIYNQRGLAQFQLDRFNEAITNFTRAIEQNATLAEAYNNRGVVHRTIGAYVRALADLRRATELGLKHAAAYLQVVRDEVRQMQQQLQQAGLQPGPADGMPGPKTIAALRTFQQRAGVPVTGRLDAATQQQLGTRPVSPSSQSETKSDLLSHFVHRPDPVYPLQARQQGLVGTVTLRLEMLADGTVGQINVLESTGHPILDAAVQKAVKQWTHNLTQQDDISGKRWGTLSFTFALDDNAKANRP